MDHVSKEDSDADKENDENINNLKMEFLEIMDKDSTNSIQEELFEIESFISIEKDQDFILIMIIYKIL